MLEANNPHNIPIPKDIRNAIQVAKHNKLGRLINVEVAVEKLQRSVGGTPSRGMKTDASRIRCMLPLKDYGYFRDFQL